MRIVVVCGAGASSTFVAARIRRAAVSRGLPLEVAASGESQLATALVDADVLLVGAHLAGRLAAVHERAAAASVAVVLLPEDAAVGADPNDMLDLALASAEARS
ncbi:PTS sugar transporter subunit IIB [Agromyces laixinhei]|uniref:PTS sugar transporter subunit IIB n=1 Tax=Agromyces laixinhei TaxID=2585717 RepID=UPI0012EECCD2|nr:PTS IIB subunit [Agromyces laixinhei]